VHAMREMNLGQFRSTTPPGFAVDEDPEHLGEQLRLPTQREPLRPQLERMLTPLTNPRQHPPTARLDQAGVPG
jgi:hypothetical protein